ncbi:hypothetical protein AK812_SmicGene12708 [Symbiodinium microadriaticum]|uniref:Uncharacterized protein n=1 Tax=Symbiodinium microadriaticum TaxID=2951 RepID=A0A1Q9E9Y5_SYMMI|nr:hypothetical protein AK812_SmicGene12708 [Symbiodinium microadriaticum]
MEASWKFQLLSYFFFHSFRGQRVFADKLCRDVDKNLVESHGTFMPVHFGEQLAADNKNTEWFADFLREIEYDDETGEEKGEEYPDYSKPFRLRIVSIRFFANGSRFRGCAPKIYEPAEWEAVKGLCIAGSSSVAVSDRSSALALHFPSSPPEPSELSMHRRRSALFALCFACIFGPRAWQLSLIRAGLGPALLPGTRQDAAQSVARPYARGAAGVKGQDIDVTELAKLKEKEAEASGQTLDERLGKLCKPKDFIRYAESRGASVIATKTGRMRISKDGVWRDIVGSHGSGNDLQKSERKKMLTSFKAMGIAFESKR